MAKVKMLTSANRDGFTLPNGSEQEFPDDEAISLCRNGLAAPIGWQVPAAAPADASSSALGDEDDDEAKPTPSKKKK